jgi:hypothetical protein
VVGCGLAAAPPTPCPGWPWWWRNLMVGSRPWNPDTHVLGIRTTRNSGACEYPGSRYVDRFGIRLTNRMKHPGDEEQHHTSTDPTQPDGRCPIRGISFVARVYNTG